ncbi:MAG TPA: hypothetical protein VK469_03950, partial [Candidatus Kapabacteria bacterium]|nr:hypothetical protein [Candidatus Kapabacteria bacterium]
CSSDISQLKEIFFHGKARSVHVEVPNVHGKEINAQLEEIFFHVKVRSVDVEVPSVHGKEINLPKANSPKSL